MKNIQAIKALQGLLIVAIIAMAVLGGAVGYFARDQINPVGEFGFNAGGYANRPCKLTSASTSPVYLEPSDSTTTDVYVTSTDLECDMGSATNGRLNLDVVASTTAVALNWTAYYSHDGIDWFAANTASTSGATVTHSAGALSDTWTPGSTSHARKSIDLDEIGSQYLKLTFDVDTASATLWALIEKQTQY